MLVGDLKEILEAYDDDESIAFFFVSHTQLHDDADALGLDLDCDAIEVAVEELEQLLMKREALSPMIEKVALQRAVNRVNKMRERGATQRKDGSELPTATVH